MEQDTEKGKKGKDLNPDLDKEDTSVKRKKSFWGKFKKDKKEKKDE
jgi:hypothetical protein